MFPVNLIFSVEFVINIRIKVPDYIGRIQGGPLTRANISQQGIPWKK